LLRPRSVYLERKSPTGPPFSLSQYSPPIVLVCVVAEQRHGTEPKLIAEVNPTGRTSVTFDGFVISKRFDLPRAPLHCILHVLRILYVISIMQCFPFSLAGGPRSPCASDPIACPKLCRPVYSSGQPYTQTSTPPHSLTPRWSHILRLIDYGLDDESPYQT
jgi:hypothetical protein